MKKEILAYTNEGSDVYYEGEEHDHGPSIICFEFVLFLLKAYAPPKKIKIILSSSEEDGFLKISLLKMFTVWYRYDNMKTGPLFKDGYDFMFRGLSKHMEDFCGPDYKGVVYVKIESIETNE